MSIEYPDLSLTQAESILLQQAKFLKLQYYFIVLKDSICILTPIPIHTSNIFSQSAFAKNIIEISKQVHSKEMI